MRMSTRPRVERAAVEGDALAHPAQAVAGAVRRRGRAPAVVDDLDLDAVAVECHPDRCALSFRVFERVGQSLLDDPVGRDVHAGRHGARRAADAELDREPGAGYPLGEGRELAQPGLGREVNSFSGVAQHAEQAAHLGQRLAAGDLDLV